MIRSTLRGALCAALLALMATPLFAASNKPEPRPYGARDDVMRFADELAGRHAELDATWLREQLQRARQLPRVQQLMMPPPAGTAKNWAAYRARSEDVV